ncbi:MAG: hypothetical protein MK085_14010, partial [Phycisphaerales bacterium]|nr:hypothetical protein [Phycisphaerales bacterium]
HLISLCDAVASRARFSGAGRALFDAAMVRMALQERYANATALLEGHSPPASTGGGAKKKSPRADSPRVNPAARIEQKPAPQPVAPATPPAPPRQVEAQPASDVSVAEARGPWAALEAAATARDQALLEGLTFERLQGDRLVLRLRPEAGSGGDWVRKTPEVLAPLVERALGPGISFEILASEVRQPEHRPGIDMTIRNRPIVKEAMDLFDASIIETRSAPTPPSGESEES